MDPYASHQEALKWVLSKTGPDIVAYEFGAGDYSTPLLHEAVKGKLITVETDRAWMDKYTHLADDHHEFVFVDINKWEESLQALDRKCDLCFIDSYDGISRVVAMNLFRDTSKYIVCHDQENVFRAQYACYAGQLDAVTRFKYCKQFEAENIITVVLSETEELQ